MQEWSTVILHELSLTKLAPTKQMHLQITSEVVLHNSWTLQIFQEQVPGCWTCKGEGINTEGE